MKVFLEPKTWARALTRATTRKPVGARALNPYHGKPGIIKLAPFDRKVVMLKVLFRTGPPINTTKLKGGKQVGNLGDECLQFIVLRGWLNGPGIVGDSVP